MFGSRKRAQEQEQRAQADRKRELNNVEYKVSEYRRYIETSESDLAEARAQGDRRREAACLRVLDQQNNALARYLTRLNQLR